MYVDREQFPVIKLFYKLNIKIKKKSLIIYHKKKVTQFIIISNKI